MAGTAQLCPYCHRLNSPDAASCYHCAASLPSPLARRLGEVVQSVLGKDSPMLLLVLAICLIVFLATLAPGFSPLGGLYRSQLERWGMYRDDVVRFEPWRYLSAVYAHGGILHFALNALALFRFGREIEVRFGSARFLLIFVLSGVLGFVASDQFTNPMATLGASGSIFGLMGSLVGQLYVLKDPDWKKWAIQILLVAAILGLVLDNIDNAAHFGGALAGFVLGLTLQRVPRDWRYERILTALAVLAVVASILSIYACATSPVWEATRMYEVQRGLWD